MSSPATSILTVTLNPALDIATSVERVEPGIKLRCGAPRIDPGGGGINVARVIMRLGGRMPGAGSDRRYHRRASAEPAGSRRHHCASDPDRPPQPAKALPSPTPSTSAQYRFILPGPQIDAETANRILAGILDAAAQMQRGGHVVFSGSMPLGLPEGLHHNLRRQPASVGASPVRRHLGHRAATFGQGPGSTHHSCCGWISQRRNRSQAER